MSIDEWYKIPADMRPRKQNGEPDLLTEGTQA